MQSVKTLQYRPFEKDWGKGGVMAMQRKAGLYILWPSDTNLHAFPVMSKSIETYLTIFVKT
jgi:hypothetical protein